VNSVRRSEHRVGEARCERGPEAVQTLDLTALGEQVVRVRQVVEDEPELRRAEALDGDNIQATPSLFEDVRKAERAHVDDAVVEKVV